jgi:hypothetical protein
LGVQLFLDLGVRFDVERFLPGVARLGVSSERGVDIPEVVEQRGVWFWHQLEGAQLAFERLGRLAPWKSTQARLSRKAGLSGSMLECPLDQRAGFREVFTPLPHVTQVVRRVRVFGVEFETRSAASASARRPTRSLAAPT